MTLTSKIFKYVKLHPKLTATMISWGIDERARLASVSSILNQMVKDKKLKRIKSKMAWLYVY